MNNNKLKEELIDDFSEKSFEYLKNIKLDQIKDMIDVEYIKEQDQIIIKCSFFLSEHICLNGNGDVK